MSKAARKKAEALPRNFATVPLEAIPKGRKGKHHIIITKIMSDLELLPGGSTLQIPRTVLNGQKPANIRSALNRATRNLHVHISTSTDDKNFYVWKR